MNNKGLTIIEMLITLSVSSIVLMMLMGITSNIIYTRNVVEYTNRIDTEIFEMTEIIRSELGDTTYASIMQYEENVDNFSGDIILITKEFEPQTSGDSIVLSRDDFKIFILVLDNSDQTIYFDLLDIDIEGVSIRDYINDSLDDDVNDFINQDDKNSILSDRIKILQDSNLRLAQPTGLCEIVLRFDDDGRLNRFDLESEDFVSTCMSNYLYFDLRLTYQLYSGNLMPERDYVTTIYIP